MERHAFAMKIKEGQMNEYRKRLGEIWPELTSYLDRSGISNYSIWNAENLIFGYYEKGNTDQAELEGKAAEGDQAELDEKAAEVDPVESEEKAVKANLIRKMEDTFTWISTPDEDMRLMYQDFGVVRKSKELIRHRMFMTKLKPACEEEYKRRHDGLIEARGGAITQGPDSNFSIWSAGGYIFGYDEIDTTMEKEETEADRESTIAWETRQLEIMDWITNDVDWMTGEHHAMSRRIAWHN